MTRRYTTSETEADAAAEPLRAPVLETIPAPDTSSTRSARSSHPTRDPAFEADLEADIEFRRAALRRKRLSRALDVLVGASLLALIGMLLAGMIRPSLILNDPEEVNRAASDAKAREKPQATKDADTKASAEKHASTSSASSTSSPSLEGRLVPFIVAPSFLTAWIPEVRAGISASDAVTAANGTEVPDANDVIGGSSPSDMLGGFGSGDLSLVEEQTKLYQGGYGSLFNPATDRVVVCRNENDPECLAVQELDHGFPERPEIDDSVLDDKNDAIHDQVVEVPGIGSTEDCTQFVVTTDPVKTTETCRPGGWYVTNDCTSGWHVTAGESWTRWTCTKSLAFATTLACRIPASLETTPETTERCYFDTNALAPVSTVKETTTATAMGVWPATCRATQIVEENLTCENVLTVTVTPDSCSLGETATSTTTGDSSLFDDGCPGADTATITTTCAKPSLFGKSFTLKLNGGYPETKITGTTGREIADTASPCRAKVTVAEHSCNGTDCLVRATIDIYYRSGTTNDWKGAISLRHPYRGYDANAGSSTSDSWANGCAALEGKKSAEAQEVTEANETTEGAAR